MRGVVRRPLKIVAVAACLALIPGLWAFWHEPSSLIVVEQRLAVPWRGRAPLRVAVLSDLHVGSPFNGLDKLREIVDRTNASKPDVVAILGDLVIQGVAGGRFVSPEDTALELGRLHAPGGIVAVLGNHDAWLDHDRVRRALEQSRIHVIEEMALRLDRPSGAVWFAGASDLWTGAHNVPLALSGVTDDAPVVLLTHNPDLFPQVPARVALTLAGHTHGGQVRFPFFGAPVVPSAFGSRFAGGHVVEEGRHLFVSTGLGTSILPVRFRVPPTIDVLTLSSN